MEHVGLDLPQFNNFFHNFAAVLIVDGAQRRRVEFVWKGRKWMRLHVTRSGSSLGMWIEHVEGVLAQYDDIFHGFLAVGVYSQMDEMHCSDFVQNHNS